MLDIQLLRNDLAGVAARLAARGFELDTAAFEQLEHRRKTLQVQSEEAQAKVNTLSKQIGELMKQGKRDEAEAVKVEVAQVKACKSSSIRICRKFRLPWTICCCASPICRTRACPWARMKPKTWKCAKSARPKPLILK